MITKKSHPDAAKRGRLFETALMRLTQWWYENFEIDDDGHIRSRTFTQVEKALANGEAFDEDGEVLRSSKSLMKRALLWRGSRDTSAQLFTALCRALDIPTRLVVSLQSVPWQANVGKPKPKTKPKSKNGKEKPGASSDIDVRSQTTGDVEDDEDDDMEEVSIPGSPVDVKGKGKMLFPGEGQTLSGVSTPSDKGKKPFPKHVVKLRKSRPAGRKLGSNASSRQSSQSSFPCYSLSLCSTPVTTSSTSPNWRIPTCILDGSILASRRAMDAS